VKPCWPEKYRPRSVKDVILAPEHRRLLDSYVADGEFTSIMLHGAHGTGKSTVSRALIADLDVDPSDVLLIKCSSEKIDALREKVEVFATTMPVGRFKVVRLEELDGMGHAAHDLLRSLIEDTSHTCRYVATCNYATKIIPALRSRFTELSFSAPDRDEVLLRMADVLVQEGVEFEVDDLERVVAAAWPDMRKMLVLMESGSKSGRLQSAEEGVTDWKLRLLPLIEAADLRGARALVCSSASPDELVDVYRFLYENLHRCPRLAQDEAVVLLAQYQNMHAFAAHGELNLAALFVELGALVR